MEEYTLKTNFAALYEALQKKYGQYTIIPEQYAARMLEY
mgnify:CR=1 FL=1